MQAKLLLAGTLASLAAAKGGPKNKNETQRGDLPCDIYARGKTPCIAAHSTTRALFKDYNGPLYEVIRQSDGKGLLVPTLSKGGVANAGAQDDFCKGTTCLISVIFDQSDKKNDLKQAEGGAIKGPEKDGKDNLASAFAAPVKLNGQKAYGVFVSPGTGYRHNNASGIAMNDDPEGMYAVFDGGHTNAKCCFDYGNAELNNTNTGDGHMEAIYFGHINGQKNGKGKGPWIMADLENGVFGGNKEGPQVDAMKHRFVTAALKGKQGHWAIRGGDAAKDTKLNTLFDGERPTQKKDQGYNPMHKEGSIVLGVGGDNSNHGQGTFYEGCMTSGYPADDIEDEVQANIKAAGYKAEPLSTGPKLEVGRVVSLQATTKCCTDTWIAHNADNNEVHIRQISDDSSDDDKKAASWWVRKGLANKTCFSFESVDKPGFFIRHKDFELEADKIDRKAKLDREDATFCTQDGLDGDDTTSLRSWNFPTRYVRHFNGRVYVARNGGEQIYFDATWEWPNDVSWSVKDAWSTDDATADGDD